MKAELINSGAIEKTVKVVVEWDEIAADYVAIFDDLRKDLRIDGFRKGKVPEGLAKHMLKPNIMLKFSNQVIEKTHQQALKEAGIDDFLDMHIVDLDFDENQPFDYTIKIENDPKIDLPDYKKGIKITRKVYVVDPETIDFHIDDFRESLAEVQEVTDGAQNGHFIVCDLQGLDASGMPETDKRLPDRLIKVGEGIFGGKDSGGKLDGAKAGDRIVLELKSAKGEPLKYAVNVKRVEMHTLPELTDDLVKGQLKEVQTVAEFREKITENLEHKWEHQSEDEFARAVTDYFIENTKFDIPPYRINFYLERIIENLKNSAKNKSVDESKVREEYQPLAEKNIRWFLIQREIQNQENIQVSEDEVQSAIDQLLLSVPENQKEQAVQYYRQSRNKMDIKMNMTDTKVLDHIKQFVKEKKETIHTGSLR
ncbi:MAG: trigger factor [Candidatus Neomarinimicrobiota bacterium]